MSSVTCVVCKAFRLYQNIFRQHTLLTYSTAPRPLDKLGDSTCNMLFVQRSGSLFISCTATQDRYETADRDTSRCKMVQYEVKRMS